jgi:hypothetical protein
LQTIHPSSSSFETVSSIIELNESKAYILAHPLAHILYQKLNRGVNNMVSDGRGRLFRRKDGKFLIYLPKDFAEDSMFPFRGADSIFVKVSFKIGDTSKLLIEKWKEPPPPAE